VLVGEVDCASGNRSDDTGDHSTQYAARHWPGTSRPTIRIQASHATRWSERTIVCTTYDRTECASVSAADESTKASGKSGAD
jgi:hypothetical protein